jgi:hypothetical protein
LRLIQYICGCPSPRCARRGIMTYGSNSHVERGRAHASRAIDHNRIRCSSKNCFSEFFAVSSIAETCCVWAQQKKAQRWTFAGRECWAVLCGGKCAARAPFAAHACNIIKLKTRLNFIYLSGSANDCTKWLANSVINDALEPQIMCMWAWKAQVHFAFYFCNKDDNEHDSLHASLNRKKPEPDISVTWKVIYARGWLLFAEPKRLALKSTSYVQGL